MEVQYDAFVESLTAGQVGNMERKHAAILVADVAGYSRLVRLDEEGTVERLMAIRREFIAPEIAACNGRIVKLMGDGILVEFPSATAAVECALAIQRAVSNYSRGLSTESQIAFRIGVNFDEVLAEGDDILGDGVNVAARLEAFARPGTVCVSARVFDEVRNKIDVPVEDFGEQCFKNISEPLQVYILDASGGGSTPVAPSPVRGELSMPEKPSIAIMPFTNLSGDPQKDYLAEGLRLHIQAKLLKLRGLFLIAPGTMARFRDSGLPPERVAHQLGVRYVLEGAIQVSDHAIRTSVELTDTVARQIVWAETYDRAQGQDFSVQDDIALQIVTALDVKLASGEKYLLRSTVTSPEALESFYRGLFHMYKGTKADNAEAQHWFSEVTRLQPDSPVGPMYLCFSHWGAAFWGWTDCREESIAEAAKWAERVLQYEDLGTTNGFAHIVLATVDLLNRRFDDALSKSQEAVRRRENCPTAVGYLAHVLHYCGRSEKAIEKIKEAIRLTPVYPPWFVTLLAAAYRDSGATEKSIAAAMHALRIKPGDLDATLILCSDYQRSGHLERAKQVASEIMEAAPDFALIRYFEYQPYRDEEIARQLKDSLRAAGLPWGDERHLPA